MISTRAPSRAPFTLWVEITSSPLMCSRATVGSRSCNEASLRWKEIICRVVFSACLLEQAAWISVLKRQDLTPLSHFFELMHARLSSRGRFGAGAR